MKIAKRIFLFIAVNLLVVTTISVVLNVLGIRPYLEANQINYGSLMAFCLVWGFGGALISLALSRIMAKWMMGVQIIKADTNSQEERWVMEKVHELARRARLPKMPEVGIYESPEVNAFATGPTKSRALVAVSTGLLRSMNEKEVEGVLGHEIAHIANGDMVTMTLVQGVVNAFVMFFSRIIAFAISQSVREESRHMVQMIVTLVLDILLSFLGMLVVAYFSRLREFRADIGGAKLAGRDNMIQALDALRRRVDMVDTDTAPGLATMKISGKMGGMMALFSTHPPLEERIRRLQTGRSN